MADYYDDKTPLQRGDDEGSGGADGFGGPGGSGTGEPDAEDPTVVAAEDAEITETMETAETSETMETAETAEMAASVGDAAPASDSGSGGAEEKKGAFGSRKKGGFFAEFFDCFETFCYALVLMMILFVFVFRFVSVNGTSMTDTLQNDDKLIISNVLYTPSTGDIVVLDAEGRFGSDKYIIKRVIATGGQKVEIDFANWNVRVDGRLLDEGYVKRGAVGMHEESWIKSDPLVVRRDNGSGGVVASFTVPDGKLFVMGDNRNGSSDSREKGFFDEASILGRVLLRVGPGKSFGRVG